LAVGQIGEGAEMKSRFRTAFSSACTLVAMAALFGVAVVTAQRPAVEADYVVCKPVINMYSAPSRDGAVVSQALYGAVVLSLEKKGEWLHIRSQDGYTGWVEAADVAAPPGGYAPEGRTVRVTGLSANLYRSPSVSDHAPLMNLPWEARLELLPGTVDESGLWLRVKLVDGRTAFVEQGNVSAYTAPLSIDQTIQLARKFLGVTYTWGGASSYGYDCSGFTQMLVHQRGILMPRDASVQATWRGLQPVERNDLKPGDLLFFGASAEKITHTGMYIGNGEFIHDTTNTHPMVQISKLDDAPWTKLLVAARRVK
jgi:SH3-like domain-containing protein